LSQHELKELQQKQEDMLSPAMLEKAGKSLLDKASLDISVTKSNLDSINIELVDSKQTINWLEKNIQEIENQLNVLNMFGTKIIRNETSDLQELRFDLSYQQKLLVLERSRVKLLQDLQNDVGNTLQLRKDKFSHLSDQLKSKRMLHMKQHQARDELAYQELQNHWLQQLNILYKRLNKIDPSENHDAYSAIEKEIYFANESASYAYMQSLIARYRDQIAQMKLVVSRNNSISLLNEIGNQYQTLNKQVARLDIVLKSRMKILTSHLEYLTQKKKNDEQFVAYLQKLSLIENQYKNLDNVLKKLNIELASFRKLLDQALQMELSARQGLPNFSTKMLIDLGKEILLLPTLAFQVVKSLTTNILRGFKNTTFFSWNLFFLTELVFLFTAFGIYKLLKRLSLNHSDWREKLNSRWLSLQCVYRNFIDIIIIFLKFLCKIIYSLFIWLLFGWWVKVY
jgi:potassium-dependent mechanosensitive channel